VASIPARFMAAITLTTPLIPQTGRSMLRRFALRHFQPDKLISRGISYGGVHCATSTRSIFDTLGVFGSIIRVLK
jgi:hypothetical protein